MIRYTKDGKVDRTDWPPASMYSGHEFADALDAANTRIRELETVHPLLEDHIRELEAAQQAPTSEEVRSLVRVLSERGKKIEWDGGDVSADQQLLHAADVIERLDRERQELKRDLALREKPFQAGRRSVIDKANESNRIIGEEYARQIERAERAEAELARVTGERDAAVKDAERWCVLKQMVGHPHDKTHLWELRQFTKGQWLWCSSDLMDERVDAFIAAAEGRNG